MKMQGIVLRNLSEPPTLAADAIELKIKAISFASKIKDVKSLPAEELAVEALRDLQSLIRDMESCRKSIKEKPWELCKLIDQLAKDYTEALDAEIKRVKKLLSDYAELKRQEALAEERKRQEELRKIEEERIKKEEEALRAARAQAEAEERARQLENDALNAKNNKERLAIERAQKEAEERAAAEAKKLAEASMAAQAQEDAIRSSMPIVAPKASGASTKFTLKYEVTNIHDLFAYAPHVVELSEKKSSVNALINGMAMANPNELPKIPGLRVWREADVTTVRR